LKKAPNLKLIKENKKALSLETGAFCNTMFSDTASKVAACFCKVFCMGFEMTAK
jgi:hypothetical protein